MRKKLLIGGLILILLSISLTGCLDEKSKFIGTWQFSEGGTIVFNNDGSVVITDISPLRDLSLIGTFTYTIANQQVTFSGGSIGVTLSYSFPNDNTLILSNDAGLSLTLTKV
jgi:hypothetical protein